MGTRVSTTRILGLRPRIQLTAIGWCRLRESVNIPDELVRICKRSPRKASG
jgi:hypothetical protein